MEDGGDTGELIPSDPAFWDHFYGPEGEASGDVFEWYLSFEHARQVPTCPPATSSSARAEVRFNLEPTHLSSSSRAQCYERFLSADSMVLQVGCGTSTLAHDLINCTLQPHTRKTQHKTHKCANRTRTRTHLRTWQAISHATWCRSTPVRRPSNRCRH